LGKKGVLVSSSAAIAEPPPRRGLLPLTSITATVFTSCNALIVAFSAAP